MDRELRIRSRVVVTVTALALALLAAGCTGGPPEPALDRQQDLDVNDRIRLSQAYVKNGRFNDAIEVLERAIKKEPAHAGLRNYYGQVLLLAGREAPAEEQLLQALELDPYLSDAYNNLGIVYDRLERRDEAEAAYRKALEDRSYPTPEKVHMNLGLLYGAQGRDEEAVASLRRAVEINPKYYQAHYELASLLDRLGQLEEAASEYDVAAPAYRNSGEFFYRSGFVLFKLGDHEEARVRLERVRELAPGSTHAVKASDVLKLIE